SISELPDKVSLRTGPLGRLSKVKAPRESNKITTRVGSSFGGNHSLEWCQPPRNILLIKKQNDRKTTEAMRNIIQYLHAKYTDINLIIEGGKDDGVEAFSDLADRLVCIDPKDHTLLADKVDLCITLGGDGTILHVSSLFDRSAVPPVLSFSMGTLGFLLPFHIDAFQTAFEDVINSKSSLLLRMRLHQTMHEKDGTPVKDEGKGTSRTDVHLMNEVALHRASSPHMTMIDAFVDGRHLTQAISDGLIIATPTGSTAYSLSAGGPIVHPSVQSLVLTPICPRSLSFRTVLLPSDANIQLKVSKRSRTAAQISVDGRDAQTLLPGQYLQVGMSPYPIPCGSIGASNNEPQLIESESSDSFEDCHFSHSERGEDDWVGDINTLLRFNASFSGRGLLGGNGAFEEME
ncbi:ATP-NAD kinase, partial [Meira miltonrushii]